MASRRPRAAPRVTIIILIEGTAVAAVRVPIWGRVKLLLMEPIISFRRVI